MQDARALIAILVGAAAAAVLLVAGAVVVAPQPVMATAAIGQKTGQPCTKCHTTPPVLNDYGKKYKESLKK